ncbi:MAG: ABC transporter permease [Armatimonadetes bacterium]|nr:ABC transporter permease [Armatimonadota bacterium]
MSAAVLRLARAGRYVVLGNPLTFGAFLMLAGLVTLALFGHWIAPYDPLATAVGPRLAPPSATHWFGTDNLGRDILSRVIVATRLDLLIAISAVTLSFAAGSAAGASAGFYGGWTERIVTRIVDTIMAFPLFVLAMGIMAAVGTSVVNIVLTVALINFPSYARIARAEVNVRRNAGYVEAARLAGNTPGRILAVHIYPNCLPTLIVQASMNMGWAILSAAGLSFIGLGVRPPTAEWGIMVSDGSAFMMSGEWWVSTFPGIALMLAVLSFNLMGDGLRDLIDPRRRS